MSYLQYKQHPLSGDELDEYRERMAEAKARREEEEAAKKVAALVAAQQAAARDSSMVGDSDDDEADDFTMSGEATQVRGSKGLIGRSTTNGAGATGSWEPEFGRFSHQDPAGTERQRRQRQQFDFKPTVRRFGDYGQPIRLTDFGLTAIYDPTNPEFTMRERIEKEARDADEQEDEDTDDDEVCTFVSVNVHAEKFTIF